MKEYKEFREIIKGRALEDYCQWRAKKEVELDEKELYALRNMQKYYEYKKMDIENGDIFNSFEMNYFSVVGMALTLSISVVIAFCGNILNGILGLNTNNDNIEQVKKVTELYQENSMDIMNLLLNGVLVVTIGLLTMLVVLFIIKNKLKKESVFKNMYCNEMNELIEEAIQNNKSKPVDY